MKIITCPHCGKVAATLGIGRAATTITVIDICGALLKHHSITAAANKLGCSRGLIYKVLKANNLTPSEVIKARIKK